MLAQDGGEEMAVVAILIGSVLGFFAGLIGFLFFGISLTSAIALYLICGIGMGLITTLSTVVACLLSPKAQLSQA